MVFQGSASMNMRVELAVVFVIVMCLVPRVSEAQAVGAPL